VFAIFGEILFEALTSPEALRIASEYSYAEHKLVEAAPRLQWLANELQKISLELGFHVAFTIPIVQMELLRAAAEDHQARPLVFGNGIHRGYFVIEGLEETHRQLAEDGSYIAISARVELREWVPGVDFDPFAPPRRTTPPPGIVQADPSTAQLFDSSPPVGPLNPFPASAVVRLSDVAAQSGVTYSAANYSQPGVSGIVAGSGPWALTPGNPGDVPPSQIVRAG
jgi:phage protein U